MMSKVDVEAVRQAVTDGRTTTQIARDLETSTMSIYRAADKAGISIRGRPAPNVSLRSAVEDMRPADALEYVLTVLEDITGQDVAGWEFATSLGLTGRKAQIFLLLHRRMGQFIATERILGVCGAVCPSGHIMSERNLAVQIHHLRRQLDGLYTITTV